MKIIAESTWSWLLYADGERRWLVVVCGTVGLYELVIELTDDERAQIAADSNRIEKLARAICSAPNRFLARHQRELLDSDAARSAIAVWRMLE